MFLLMTWIRCFEVSRDLKSLNDSQFIGIITATNIVVKIPSLKSTLFIHILTFYWYSFNIFPLTLIYLKASYPNNTFRDDHKTVQLLWDGNESLINMVYIIMDYITPRNHQSFWKLVKTIGLRLLRTNDLRRIALSSYFIFHCKERMNIRKIRQMVIIAQTYFIIAYVFLEIHHEGHYF